MNNLSLIKTRISDLSMIVAFEQEVENAQFITPNTLEEHTNLIHDPNIDHLLLFSKKKELLGFVILAGLTNENMIIEFRRIVIFKKGRGYGRDAIQLIKDYSFKKLNADRLWLDVLTSNSRARYLYQSEGFKEEEILVNAIKRDGMFHDLVIMAILKH